MDQRTAELLADEDARADMAAHEFDREFLAVHLAGIASGLAGIFSMAAGEYIGSKSQREIFEAQIVDEREEVHERPGEAQAEIAYMFEEDGLPREAAVHLSSIMAE